MTWPAKERSYNINALSLEILGEYLNAIHHDIAISCGQMSTSTKEKMIAARALVRNVAANEQDWNANINSKPGMEYMCVNPVRHNESHISVSSGDHHLHKVKCYR